MAFISLGEAFDRVLEKLAVERGNEKAGGIDAPRKVALAEGRITERGGAHGITCAKLAKTERDRARRAARR